MEFAAITNKASDLCTHVYEQLEAIPSSFDGLFHDGMSESFFLSRPWFLNLSRTALEPRTKLQIYAVNHSSPASKFQGLLLARSPAAQNGSVLAHWRLGPRTLASLTNFQSSYYAPLVTGSADSKAVCVEALASAVCDRKPAWEIVDFNLLDPLSCEFSILCDAFRKRGFAVRPYVYMGNWYETFDGMAFEDYLRSRNKKSREEIKNYQRKQRQLERDGRIRFEIITNAEQLSRGLAAYNEIHAHSWKDQDHFPHFGEGLMRTCAQEGLLRLGLVYIDGVPAGAEMAVVASRKAYMMRTAYHAQFRKVSPGALAMMLTIQHLFEVDKICQMDFGIDDNPYKATWVALRRERWGTLAFNLRTLRGALGLVRYGIAEKLAVTRQRIRRLVTRPQAETSP